MFAVGENVLYGTDGVCTIAEHGMRNFFGNVREYYVLKPNAHPDGVVYVPADNPVLVERMRRLLTKEAPSQMTKMANLRTGSRTTANGSTPTTRSCKAATASGSSE